MKLPRLEYTVVARRIVEEWHVYVHKVALNVTGCECKIREQQQFDNIMSFIRLSIYHSVKLYPIRIPEQNLCRPTKTIDTI